MAEGPSTAHELAAILEIPLAQVHSGLCGLKCVGHIRKTGQFHRPSDSSRREELYELTPRGRSKVKRSREATQEILIEHVGGMNV